jgi:pimeloyl-ACP methyl ester carboxylesterase
MGNGLSIYKKPEYEKKLMSIYDSRLADWPLHYKSIFLDTSYSKVHVIVSDPEDAPPILLYHVSELAAWSWLPNIAVISKQYRTYAVDHIGEAGKSVLKDTDVFPKDGKALSDFYIEISNKLGVQSAVIIGESNGGCIALNYALYTPKRV